MPSRQQIEEQNRYLVKRHEQFKHAAERVAEAFGGVDGVLKVVLFGSCAAPLWKEVPRFREYRRRGIKVWHETKDVDLAVWLSDLGKLKALQKVRSRALSELFQEEEIGVAHHQVDVFIMEPGTNRYVGRLCIFGTCPKGKSECMVEGCGKTRFLRIHEDFALPADALSSEKCMELYKQPELSSFKREEPARTEDN